MIINRLLFLLLIIFLLNACAKPSLEDYKLLELNRNFEFLMDGLRNKSENLLETVKKSVVKSGNTEVGRANIRQAEDLKKQTSKLLQLIDSLKRQVKIDSTDKLAYAQVRKVLLGEQGKSLVQKMDSFQVYLNNNFKDFALKSSDFIHLTKAKKDYLQENFAGVNLAEALVLLSEKQIQVARNEQVVLNKFIHTPRETIFPIVSAKSKWVKAGETYQAEVFLLKFTKIQNNPSQKITMNGQSFPINQFGFGEVRFKAQGSGEQTWRGSITSNFRNHIRDTTFTFEKKYYVIPK